MMLTKTCSVCDEPIVADYRNPGAHAEKHLRPAPAAGPWISAKDRKPGKIGLVLVTDGLSVWTMHGEDVPEYATHWSEIVPPKESE